MTETIQKQHTQVADEELIIRETVDGREATATVGARSTRGGQKPAARPHSDPYIWGIYIFLLIVSVVELYSASSSEVTAGNVYGPLIRHGIFIAVGFGLVVAFQNMHYSVFRRTAAWFALLSLGLLVLSNLVGININGAQRAISIAGFTVQPAEIVKLTVVVWLAEILAKSQMPGGVTNRGVVMAGMVVIVFCGMLYANGLTNMILLMGTSLSMFLIGGMQWRKVLAVLAVYLLCFVCYTAIKDRQKQEDAYDRVVAEQVSNGGRAEADQQLGDGRDDTRKNRIQRFIAGVHPDDPMDDLNRQVILANFAQANGGMFGRGPGNSRESARLPLAFSDYIYSIVVEETGFLGGCILLGLYLFLLARAGRIADRCNKAFPALLIMGCAVLIVFQALVHMAIVTGVFPVSGQPLPLISKGGTSILVMSAAIGMMLSVSRTANTRRRGTRAERKAEDAEADNPTQLSRAEA